MVKRLQTSTGIYLSVDHPIVRQKHVLQDLQVCLPRRVREKHPAAPNIGTQLANTASDQTSAAEMTLVQSGSMLRTLKLSGHQIRNEKLGSDALIFNIGKYGWTQSTQVTFNSLRIFLY